METKSFRLRPDVVYVSDKALDYAIVAVSPHTSSDIPLSQFGYLRLFKQTGKVDPTQRQAANIIQHPGAARRRSPSATTTSSRSYPIALTRRRTRFRSSTGRTRSRALRGRPCVVTSGTSSPCIGGSAGDGTWLTANSVSSRWDKTPAAEGDSSEMLRYVTNEGTRVSRIYHSLQEKAGKENNAHAAEALRRIAAVAADPRTGPVSQRTTPILLPSLPGVEGGGPEEITHRGSDRFDGAAGYVPMFLGEDHPIPLPQMSSEVRRELATLKDSTETELKYANYSVDDEPRAAHGVLRRG